jgi:hypothetical protein
VGSIGTEVTDATLQADLYVHARSTAGGSSLNESRLWLLGGDSGIVLDGYTNAILPTDENSYEDNRTNIGSSDYRFKDLYLSGGVVFNVAGGTGTSTSGTLDDYEEGTWTPVFKRTGSTSNATISYQDAKYTKVGRLVTLTVYVTSIDYSPVTDGTFAIIEGLPFATSGWTSGTIGYGGATNVSETNWVANGTIGQFLAASGNGFANVNPDLNRGMFSVTYQTA